MSQMRPIFHEGTTRRNLKECWVNLYDRDGECRAGYVRSKSRTSAERVATRGTYKNPPPFARVHVMPKTNPKAQEVFS